MPKKKWKSVKRVLLAVNKAKKYGLQYSGRTIGDAGQPITIIRGSTEESIIANWMENELGFRNTTIVVDEYSTNVGKKHVGRNASMNSFMRMIHVINKI